MICTSVVHSVMLHVMAQAESARMAVFLQAELSHHLLFSGSLLQHVTSRRKSTQPFLCTFCHTVYRVWCSSDEVDPLL